MSLSESSRVESGAICVWFSWIRNATFAAGQVWTRLGRSAEVWTGLGRSGQLWLGLVKQQRRNQTHPCAAALWRSCVAAGCCHSLSSRHRRLATSLRATCNSAECSKFAIKLNYSPKKVNKGKDSERASERQLNLIVSKCCLILIICCHAHVRPRCCTSAA